MYKINLIPGLFCIIGAHTIGQARCVNFRSHIYNDSNIDTSFATMRKTSCPRKPGSGDNNLAPLDIQTTTAFDNYIFKNILRNKGLLHSDEALLNMTDTASLVEIYSTDTAAFFADFAAAMVKMGDVRPLTGIKGEIRGNCRKIN